MNRASLAPSTPTPTVNLTFAADAAAHAKTETRRSWVEAVATTNSRSLPMQLEGEKTSAEKKREWIGSPPPASAALTNQVPRTPLVGRDHNPYAALTDDDVDADFEDVESLGPETFDDLELPTNPPTSDSRSHKKGSGPSV
jgi:hypothetical protein